MMIKIALPLTHPMHEVRLYGVPFPITKDTMEVDVPQELVDVLKQRGFVVNDAPAEKRGRKKQEVTNA